MPLDARKQDTGPIDPPEVALDANQVEQAVEEALADLFNKGEPKAAAWLVNEIHRDLASVAAALIKGESDGEYWPCEEIVAKARNEFISHAKNAPEWDYVRREVEAA